MIVKIKIDQQIYADYLAYIFPPDVDGVLKVSSGHVFGDLLIAHCREAPRPIFNIDQPEYISLRLPKCESTQNLRNKFLFSNAGDMIQLNRALRAIFDLDFIGYYRKGQAAQFSKKDIIEGFITSRHLITADYVDSLNKRVYRRQQKETATLTKKLLRKAYYIEEAIDDTYKSINKHRVCEYSRPRLTHL